MTSFAAGPSPIAGAQPRCVEKQFPYEVADLPAELSRPEALLAAVADILARNNSTLLTRAAPPAAAPTGGDSMRGGGGGVPEEPWMAYVRDRFTILGRLGRGGFGSVWKARPLDSTRAPPRDEPAAAGGAADVAAAPPSADGATLWHRSRDVALKVMPISTILQNAMRVKHLAVELAALQLPRHRNLNTRLAVFHTAADIIVELELVEFVPRPTVLTRLAHSIAVRRPSRLDQIDAIYAEWRLLAARDGGIADPERDEDAFGAFVDRRALFPALAARLQYDSNASAKGLSPEVPSSGSVFELIVAYRRLPDALARAILRQLMLALEHLHRAHVVHRDLKTENCCIAIGRSVTLRRDPATNLVNGATFDETVRVVLVDFGFAKYVVQDAPPPPPSLVPAASAGTTTTTAADQRRPSLGMALTAATLSASTSSTIEQSNTMDAFRSIDTDHMNVTAVPPSAGGGGGFGDAPSPAFPIAVTPLGTDLYMALECVKGVLAHMRSKWTSTNKQLYLLDTYGAGTILFCMSNGRPPFRPPETYRRVSKEERLRQIERLIEAGPQFLQCVPAAAKAMTLRLLESDLSRRLTAAQALRDPYLRDAKDTLRSEYTYTGLQTVVFVENAPAVAAAAAAAASSVRRRVEKAANPMVGDDEGDAAVPAGEAPCVAEDDEASDDDADHSAFVEGDIVQLRRELAER
jgi:serine/threonine protein kinase